ncbi:putative F-box protein At5g47300 [Silene latifolia]|uniref:putative F-box protein At5g47300 n=1 Tax=Silene latifolia TaxID=37657 RepID=UPI003D789915
MTNPQISSSSNNQFTQISEFKFLPPEIWFQILAKLPAKTLLILRCVCKSWCSIIDNPDFIHIHLQISQTNFEFNNRSLVALDSLGHRLNGEIGYSLTLHHLETLRETDLIFRISDSYRYHIIGSCNGLILVSRNQDPPFHKNKELRLWNPCIRKSLVIPACPFHRSLLLYCVFLFGYAAISKDYKIVAIASEKSVGEELRKMYVAVYTLRDQQWTVRNDGLNISFPNTICMLDHFVIYKASVFLKGVAYWLGNIDENRNHIFHLCSFDFDKEEIAFLELPSSWDESDSVRHLFLLGD